MQIDQMVPALHDADATGDSVRALRDYLRRLGYASDIYAYDIDENISQEALPFRISQPKLQQKDVLILHYALPSGMNDFLKQVDCKKAIIYHNITPASYWYLYDSNLVHLATAGRQQLENLAPFVDRSAGVSEFNRQELEKIGFRNTCVLPIYMKYERYRIPPSPFVLRQVQDGTFNFLFVGRVVPNKKLEDIIKLCFFYKRLYNPICRAIFVGKTNVVPAYHSALRSLTAHLGIMQEDILFAGHVDWPELVAYYKSSHVFVSMSEHEGFGVPLIEAMICDTPIVAYSCAGIPYVLEDAGLQFTEKDLVEVAGMCHRVGTDSAFREEILKTQRKQLKKYSAEEIERAIQQFLAPLL